MESEVVKKRVIKGVGILTARTVLIQAIAFFANVLLTVFLEPSEYGVFFIVSALINFLAYFGDIGFAAALIQKKEKLTQQELRTVFSAQQLLVLTILIAVLIATPVIVNLYKLDQKSIYLLWAVAFSLVLSSLKTIPNVLLERKLEFNKWVIPQIVETIVFNISVVFLAWKGFGVTSFTIGVLLRGFSGLIMTYMIQPWLPGLAFSVSAFKSVLKFGVPYQANALLAMIKDDGMTLLLGGILGQTGIGLLGWAQKWAYAPLRFFMDQVIKVTFPAFSRLQDEKQELSNAVSRAILFICILSFPSLVILVLVAPSLTEIIPKYSKWNPALTALTLISITSALASITTPLTNTLNAIGKVSITFKLMIMWTALTWILVPALAVAYGLNGAAFGFTLVGLSSFVAIFIASKYVTVDYLQSVGKPLMTALLMGFILYIVRSLLPISLMQVILMIVAGLIIYTVIIILLEPKIINMTKSIFKK
ncbi:MAG: Polysaccharide biosynthesis protein [Microgenomates group bacterium Gr01-1014_7]|nr:MAG: Polysaccharide biosynthesis protein [Microgenomates group bacterium Gr01-1014_7]